MHGTFVPKNFKVIHFTSLHPTSIQNKITSHISRQFTPHHFTSHHFPHLHPTPTLIPLLVTTFLTFFLNVFSLQGKTLGSFYWSYLRMNIYQHLSYVALCHDRLILLHSKTRVCHRSLPANLFSFLNRKYFFPIFG